MYESKDKMVSHPDHYKGTMGVEPIDFIHEICKNIYINAKTYDCITEGHIVAAFDLGQVIKYVCRYTKKNGSQDIDKAMWYMHDFMDSVWQVLPGTTLKPPKEIGYDEAIDMSDAIINSVGFAPIRLWAHALCDHKLLEISDREFGAQALVLTWCYIVSTDYRKFNYVSALQIALKYLYKIVKEREVEENARKAEC